MVKIERESLNKILKAPVWHDAIGGVGVFSLLIIKPTPVFDLDFF